MNTKNKVKLDFIIPIGERKERFSLYVPKDSTLLEAIKTLPIDIQLEFHKQFGTWIKGMGELGETKEGYGWQFYIQQGAKEGLPVFITKSSEAKFPGLDNLIIDKSATIEFKYENYTTDITVPGCSGAFIQIGEKFLVSECDLFSADSQERTPELKLNNTTYSFHNSASTNISITASRTITPQATTKTQSPNILKQDQSQQTYHFNYPVFSQVYSQSNQQTLIASMTGTETKKESKITQFLFPISSISPILSSIQSTKQKLQDISLPIKAEFVKSISRIKAVVRAIPKAIQNIPQTLQKITIQLTYAANKQISKILAIIIPTINATSKRIKISSPVALIQNTIRKTKINLAILFRLLFAPRKKEKEQTLHVQSNNSSGFGFWNTLQRVANSLFVLPVRLNNSTYFYFIAFVLIAITAAYCLLK
jgi:hypothetical protein